jgi:HEAT repeat protein
LLQALNQPGKERIKDLVKNPLRLTLLCAIWHLLDGNLPDTKAELYQQFVEEVYRWKQVEFLTTPEEREQLNTKLQKLALVAIDKEENKFCLQEKLIKNLLGDDFQLALNLGWLNQVGIDVKNCKPIYAFYHTTFEEYFAALAIADWHEFLNHVPDNPALGVYRIFAPQWKEVILLWLGREDVEKKEEFIQALVEFDDGCGEYRAIDRVRRGFYEFRAYFLAAAGVDEWKNSCNADAIVAEIVKWSFGEFKVEQNEWVYFLYPILKEAQTGLPQTNRIKAIAALVELIGNPQLDDSTRRLAASSLGKIDPGNQKAINALLELIVKPQLDEDTLWQAVSSLEEIGSGNQKAIDALLELIGNPQLDDGTRSLAVYSLGKIGSGNQKAIDTLLELIGNLQLDDDTRREAAESLGEIDPGNQKAIDALVKLIGNPQLDDGTRSLATSSLERIGSGNQKAIDALMELIGKPQLDDSTLWLAVESLVKIGSGNQKAIDTLVGLIGKPQLDYSTQIQAASKLEIIGSGNQKAIDALVELISNPQLDDDTRRQAAESLGKIGSGNQKAIDVLVELIGNLLLDEDTLWQPAYSLEKILLEEQMPNVVTVLKDYLSPETYKNDLERFFHCYKVIWKCAQSMTYPAFYQAWHQQEIVKDGE